MKQVDLKNFQSVVKLTPFFEGPMILMLESQTKIFESTLHYASICAVIDRRTSSLKQYLKQQNKFDRTKFAHTFEKRVPHGSRFVLTIRKIWFVSIKYDLTARKKTGKSFFTTRHQCLNERPKAKLLFQRLFYYARLHFHSMSTETGLLRQKKNFFLTCLAHDTSAEMFF